MKYVEQEIHSLETINEYKKKNLKNVKKIVNEYLEHEKSFKRNEQNLRSEIKQSKDNEQFQAKQYFVMQSSMGSLSTINVDLAQGNTKRLSRQLQDVLDDIQLAREKRVGSNQVMVDLRRSIKGIEDRVEALKRNEKVKKKTAGRSVGKVVVECPKICTINNVVVKCQHNERAFTLNVNPQQPADDIPYLHVISGSEEASYDVIDVNFGGSCDFGKSASSGDSAEHKQFKRDSGHDQYCPKVEIINGTTGTRVHRPSKVSFAAALPEKSIISSGKLKVLNDLIFDKENATQDFDLEFNSCTGSYPYQARVIVHPKWAWNLEMTFGYKQSTKIEDSAYSYEDSLYNKIKYLFTSKPENFDDLESSGSWEAGIKASCNYDTYILAEFNQTYTLKGLAKEMQADWGFLKELDDFTNPINGFFELAKHKNKITGGDNKVSDDDATFGLDVEWTKLKIAGKAENVEIKNSAEVGIKGTFSIGFEPLFGLKGRMNIMQLLLSSLGGPFGAYLNKVSNMSLGTKDEQGKIDTDKTYIKTNLEVIIEAEAAINGGLAFESTGETFWQAAKSDVKLSEGLTGGTQVTGFVGLTLKGDASIRGLIWDVRFASGAMFKTASEDGTKASGVEVSLKPVIINNKYSAAGYVEFTGLSVIYALYAKLEAAGLKSKKSSGDAGEYDDDTVEAKTTIEQKNETKHILFKKRLLGQIGDETLSLGA